MSLYHLDPRHAATGAAPDVEIWSYPEPYAETPNGLRSWAYSVNGGPHDSYAQGFQTEHTALHAAREAAGFGHVAERPCGAWKPVSVIDGTRVCDTCAWPRDAHTKGDECSICRRRHGREITHACE